MTFSSQALQMPRLLKNGAAAHEFTREDRELPREDCGL
jgi:hypothetical protein